MHTPLSHAVAYFNTDVGVAGPDFGASAVPSLRTFLREVTREVPSPKGGTVYDQWLKSQGQEKTRRVTETPDNSSESATEVRVGTLGSGSDFTPFIQHLGVPSTDVGSEGPYGVYHSVFDNYNWFIRNADPTFVYEQEMARVFGLEILHMADADFLPYDYALYGNQIATYLADAARSAAAKKMPLDSTAATTAAKRLAAIGQRIHTIQSGTASTIPRSQTKCRPPPGRERPALRSRPAQTPLVQTHHLRSRRVHRLRRRRHPRRQ